MTGTLNHLWWLTAGGVQFKGFTEQYLDSTRMFREASISFLAAIANQGRVRFSERIKAGQVRNKKQLGQPALAGNVVAELRRLRGERVSFGKIQGATGVPVATMHKYLVG